MVKGKLGGGVGVAVGSGVDVGGAVGAVGVSVGGIGVGVGNGVGEEVGVAVLVGETVGVGLGKGVGVRVTEGVAVARRRTARTVGLGTLAFWLKANHKVKVEPRVTKIINTHSPTSTMTAKIKRRRVGFLDESIERPNYTLDRLSEPTWC